MLGLELFHASKRDSMWMSKMSMKKFLAIWAQSVDSGPVNQIIHINKFRDADITSKGPFGYYVS